MTAVDRRTRERAQRRATILDAARALAESHGWDAVTTRRLAERIEYSQPVLYSHFASKSDIVDAVAREGFADLAADLRARVDTAPDRRAALAGAAEGYLAFARDRPAVYAAMFTGPTSLPFAAPDTPSELLAGFAALRDALAGVAVDPAEIDLRTELLWSTLHGLATLTAAGRVPREAEDARLALLVRSLAG